MNLSSRSAVVSKRKYELGKVTVVLDVADIARKDVNLDCIVWLRFPYIASSRRLSHVFSGNPIQVILIFVFSLFSTQSTAFLSILLYCNLFLLLNPSISASIQRDIGIDNEVNNTNSY